MGTPVSELYAQPFSFRSLEVQQRIIQEGPARPNFNSSEVKESGGSLVRFEEVVYSKAEWITGCPLRSAFVCWPCLLFAKNEWVHTVTDYKLEKVKFLLKYIREHEKSFEHIEAEFDLKLFCMQHLKSPNMDLKVQSDAEIKQRDVLRRLIDVVFKNVVREANHRKSNYCGQINVEDCVSVLQLTQIYDNYCLEEINCVIDLIKQSPKIVCDIVDSMTSVVKLAIKNETQLSTYVSLILSEHSEVSDGSLVSTVLRYLRNSHVCERFIGFSSLSNKADDVFKHIENILREFQIYERFLFYSLDGGVLLTSEFLKLFDVLKKEYPFAFSLPWHSHSLEYVLQQCFSFVKECKYFFKFINAIENYFKNSKRWKAFEDFMDKKKGISITFKWFTKSSVITVVHTNRKNFFDFFDLIVKFSIKWDTDDVVKALGFRQYLQEPLTVFLLEMFSRLFDLTDSFSSSLHGGIPGKMFYQSIVDDLKLKLKFQCSMGFKLIWSNFISQNIGKTTDCLKTKCHKLFSDIYCRTLEEIAARFDEMAKLEFCRIKPRDESKNYSYIDLYLGNPAAAQGSCIVTEEIRNELNVLKERIPMTSLEEFHHFLLQTNVKDAMPSVFKSVEFTLTQPTQRTACGKKSSKLKEITKWVFDSEHLVTAGDISVLCVELDFLLDLSKSALFYNEVMSLFLKNLKQQLIDQENYSQVNFFSEIMS